MNHYFKLYPGDYLRDTMHLSTEQHGAYFLLMLHYYALGPLPADDSQLRRIMRLELDAYARVWPTVRGFFRLTDGLWRHKRIDEELEHREKVYTKQATGAAITNQRRWGSVTDTDSDSVSDTPTDALTVSQPEPEPKPYPEPVASSKDQATKLPRGPSKKLQPSLSDTAKRFEAVLGHQWVNDAGKWIQRIKRNHAKAQRVVAEVENAAKEDRINSTPAQYAEQIWKEFA